MITVLFWWEPTTIAPERNGLPPLERADMPGERNPPPLRLSATVPRPYKGRIPWQGRESLKLGPEIAKSEVLCPP